MKRRLKLAEGRSVPMEDGSAWPAEGVGVEDSLYVRRRLRDGDVVEIDDELEPATPPVPPETLSPEPPVRPQAEPKAGNSRKGGK